MPAYGIIGGQWGDEGKGKVIDYLSKDAHIVARYAGGNNAGHTVINELGESKFHLVPSGIFWPQAQCIIGNGVVVDPKVLLDELDGLSRKGVDLDRLHISDRASVVMPYHILLDQLEEQARGEDAIGTTGKGIGPAYSDKSARAGIRMGELINPDLLLERLKVTLAQKNTLITQVYGGQPFSLETMYHECAAFGEQLKSYVHSTHQLIHEALRAGKNILMEGAQGTLLDIDHGTYPYVTSSSSSIGGACVGLGIPPNKISSSSGVFKAYTTRVGSGPLPSELLDEVGETIRELAWEYGTTTGRARRVGWFDAVAARYSVELNGFSSAILTRLDVLDGMSPVKICVGYELDGETINQFPDNSAQLERCRPIFEEHPGWDIPTASTTTMSQLPSEAVNYVRRLENLIGCPVDMISTGPHRDETILINQII